MSQDEGYGSPLPEDDDIENAPAFNSDEDELLNTQQNENDARHHDEEYAMWANPNPVSMHTQEPTFEKNDGDGFGEESGQIDTYTQPNDENVEIPGEGNESTINGVEDSNEETNTQGPSPEAIYWLTHKLECTLALNDAIVKSGISDDVLCSMSMERNVQTQVIPIAGILRKSEDGRYGIQTNESETRRIQIGDLVYFAIENPPKFVISKSTQIESHIFKVELTPLQDGEMPSGDAEIFIKEFVVDPIPVKCKTATKAEILESWMALFNEALGADAHSAVRLETNPIVEIFSRFANDKNYEGKFPDWVLTYFTKIWTEKSCPYPLVDNQCIDLSNVYAKTRTDDISSYDVYVSEVRDLKGTLNRILDPESVEQLCANLTGTRKMYLQIMQQNAALWQTFAEQNLRLKTTVHIVLHQLIRHYLEQLEIPKRNVASDAARLWLRFYIKMPLFFFALSQYAYKFRAMTTKSFRAQVVYMVRYFHDDLLTKHLNDFLPSNRTFANVDILNQVRRQLQGLALTLKDFKYAPTISSK